MSIVVTVTACLALLPVALGLLNLFFFRRLPRVDAPMPRVSVLVPARNEESGIGRCLDAILADAPVDGEVLVYDDASEDRTAEIVRERAAKDERLRLISGSGPPDGWNGKQHACDRLGRSARGELLVFLDADVRLGSGALSRMARHALDGGSALSSGFPRQETGSFSEHLLIPMMHFLLLGYLPFVGMRLSRRPAFGAGCGQLFVTRAAEWKAMGGHAAIRGSRHDGVTLPRAFRGHGLRTTVFDASDLARCRMYAGAREVIPGLMKNATEGLATPVGIWVWTALLLAGQVLPVVLLPIAASPLLVVSVTAPILFRLVLAFRLGHSPWGALLHPVGVLLLLIVQWRARLAAARDALPDWRGRPVVTPAAESAAGVDR